MSKLKIELYTCGWNESFQLPFAIGYWQRFISDETDFHVFYFDNMSDDNSLEVLSKYDWITVRQFDSNGEMNEDLLTYIRNNCWKNSKADFVIVCDVDEEFYSNDIISELKSLKEKGTSVIGCKWYALCGDSVPAYNPNTLLHQQIGKVYPQYINHKPGYGHLGKIQLFNPQVVASMNYSPGMHISTPVDKDGNEIPVTVTDNIIQIHFDKGYGYQYVIDKRRQLWNRLNERQKRAGYCYEYNFPEEQIRQEYKRHQEESFDINTI